MGSALKCPDGSPLVWVTLEKDARDARFTDRVASRLVNVAVPKLMPAHLTAILRARTPNADDRLERIARRLARC